MSDHKKDVGVDTKATPTSSSRPVPKRSTEAPQASEPRKIIGTKDITVYATRSFVTLPKEIQSETRTRIGAFAADQSGFAYRCLSDDELLEVGKEVIGLSHNDPKFGERVDQFFNDFSLPIPYSEGMKIKVPVDQFGEVVWDRRFLRQIMAYRHVMACPRVAKSYAELQDLDVGYYIAYIEDKSALKVGSVAAKEARKKANRLYLKLVQESKENERDWVCELLRRGLSVTDVKIPNGTFIPSSLLGAMHLETVDVDDRELALEETKDRYPTEFNELVEDPDLEMRALLEKFIDYGVMRREGNVIMHDREAIGSDDGEALATMKSSAFSQTLLVCKEKLKNAVKREKQKLSII